MITYVYLAVIILLLVIIFNRITCGISKSPAFLVGKTAIITGANRGIGYRVALSLASRGCRVIIADRDDAERSKNKIIEKTGNPNVVTHYLDLVSVQSIRKFAEKIIETEKRVDILVNNAGVGVVPKGSKHIMQINHLGPFLLTHLLIDLLKKSAPSRIIFTSSGLAYFGHLNIEYIMNTDIKNNGFLYQMKKYSDSKKCAYICAKELAEKLRGTGVTSNSLHPGLVRTRIFSTMKGFGNVLIYIGLYLFGKSSWEGSQTTLELALSKELEATSAYFFADCTKFNVPLPFVNKDIRKEIWRRSEEMSGLKENEKFK